MGKLKKIEISGVGDLEKVKDYSAVLRGDLFMNPRGLVKVLWPEESSRFAAIAVPAIGLPAFSSIALATQFDLVLNCRSTGVIGFNTNGSAIGFDNAVNMMGG